MNELMIVAFLLVLVFLLVRGRRAFASKDRFAEGAEGERFAHKWGYKDTRFEFGR